jgi:Spy/CpxP family protein refolding chaperone
MKRMKTITVILAMALIFGGNVFTAMAQDHSSGDRGFKGGFIKELFTKLQLSEVQKQEIATILKQHKEKAQPLRQSTIEARMELMEAITADEFNESAVREAAGKVAQSAEELAVLRAEICRDVKQILTPEQLETFRQWKEEMKGKLQKRMEKMQSRMDNWIDAHTQE